MNIVELEQRLLDEGCNPDSFAIGQRGGASDAFCLVHDGSAWTVFYTERGIDHSPFFTSPDEAEACAFFFKHMMSFRYSHLVGFFREPVRAEAMLTTLKAAGLNAWRDAIPYRDGEWWQRVFVMGKDIFTARRLFPDLPLHD